MMPAEPVRVLRVIARLNAGGPAHHVGILSSRMGPLGYETLLVHGCVRRDEAELPRFAERYPCRRRAIGVLRPELRPWDDIRALLRLTRTMRAERSLKAPGARPVPMSALPLSVCTRAATENEPSPSARARSEKGARRMPWPGASSEIASSRLVLPAPLAPAMACGPGEASIVTAA